MFPLPQRIIIPSRDFAGHIKAGLGGAVDYRAVYVPFVIPFDGTVSHRTGPQGGLQLVLTRPNGDRIEFFHLKAINVADGNVKAGTQGGITGNSGLLKPGAPPYAPHSHIQIFNSKGVRLDPEKYNWLESSSLKKIDMFRTFNGTVYLLAAGYWIAVNTTYDQFLADFGNISAPAMTEAQFKAFPVTRPTIK